MGQTKQKLWAGYYLPKKKTKEPVDMSLPLVPVVYTVTAGGVGGTVNAQMRVAGLEDVAAKLTAVLAQKRQQDVALSGTHIMVNSFGGKAVSLEVL